MPDSRNVPAAQAYSGLEIAVIGMAGRFPEARSIDEYWENLKNGKESVHFFSDEELAAAGIASELIQNPRYIRAKALVPDAEWFDSDFFEYTPREAEVIDPQIRLFHEVAWEALEHAGYDPEQTSGSIGLFAGASASIYWQMVAMLSRSDSMSEQFAALALSDKDFLSTRIAHKLNLKGPSVNVDSACSTSLLAIHLACRSLLTGECKIALAGGATVTVPRTEGYLHEEGMISSPDGHCRAFDAKAKGTIGGEGAGAVVLKTLKQALADGDCIYAVIKGSAANNDGTRKMAYSAPSIEGQAEVIRAAQRMARVSPESISYIEAHGTGTTLGDPVEIEALKLAFQTEKKGYCRIGSVKTNIGHLNSAAGVAAFMKTVLSLQHKKLPASLHFEQPNPKIDFGNSPFVVNTELTTWQNENYPLRAGVSSFGIGGTNVHVVLEEAPAVKSGDEGREAKLLLLSARTEAGLEQATARFLEYLRRHPDTPLADIAYTLQAGRRSFRHRRMLVAFTSKEACSLLASRPADRVITEVCDTTQPRLVFMFPGQGSQYVNMGLDLYEQEPFFRETVDQCLELARSKMNVNLKSILYPPDEQALEAGKRLGQTDITQPALFIFSYALARQLMNWGLQPSAMIGHSVGEYVAACLSGVMALEDALGLVIARGQLMHSAPAGAMLSVRLSEQELAPLLHERLSVAAVNGTALCVVSGAFEDIEEVEKSLLEQGAAYSRLHTSHAFHSSMMEPVMEPFIQQFHSIHLHKPKLPYISNVTGTWIASEEAGSAEYWAKHLRGTVRFDDGLGELLKDDKAVFVEVGPGNTLSTFVRRHSRKEASHHVVSLVRHPKNEVNDSEYLLQQLGRLWLAGARIDWKSFYAGERRLRVALPTYPFERRQYWVDPPRDFDILKQGLSGKALSVSDAQRNKSAVRKETVGEWLYTPAWERSILEQEPARLSSEQHWVAFIPEEGLGVQLVEKLRQEGANVTVVHPSTSFAHVDAHTYRIKPGEAEHYDRLLQELSASGQRPSSIIHAWLTSGGIGVGTIGKSSDAAELGSTDSLDLLRSQQMFEYGYYSLIALAKAIGWRGIQEELNLYVVTATMQEVTGEEKLIPEQASVLGACLVIPQEYPNVKCRSIDIVHDISPNKAAIGGERQQALLDSLHREITSASHDLIVAYRGTYRWVQKFIPVPEVKASANMRLREKGVYLVTGGLGGIGLTLAEYLAKTVKAKLVLTGRSVPNGPDWRSFAEMNSDDQDLAAKLSKLAELEEYGAEVLVCRADVSDEQQMEQVVNQAMVRFGTIHGVIHAAGTADGALIQRRTPELEQRAMAAKVKGTQVLGRVLGEALTGGRKLDFLVLCSSLVSVLGAIGQAGYCAANAYLDSYAYRKQGSIAAHMTSINWDGWKGVGMAAAEQETAATRVQPPAIHEAESKVHGVSASGEQQVSTMQVSAGQFIQGASAHLLPEEGIAVFHQALSSGLPQVLVSTTDLSIRMQKAREASLHSMMKEGNEADEQASQGRTVPIQIPAGDELEQLISQLWREYLGVDELGLHDNFFELGATSLDLIQMNTKLKKALHMEVSVVDMFSHSTIHSLAELIRRTASGAEPQEQAVDRSEQISEGKSRLKQRLNRRDRK
ncbi:type I polyketide synthase [Paenibacillus lentus]|uniref:SDR family NAD(P)-dependent oxidoreductase n=1 Tax=Paenibacillus lentus TaxID=1338368 RepID=A0A3Q8SDZ4_9BACL|nr:type I polyketide synthase [Paenibacillus lentus]AZK48522.1 SDR family NAD(P)-dependent oxidoreductase [Paenibacillus lentus]